jgi:hypothetical protein
MPAITCSQVVAIECMRRNSWYRSIGGGQRHEAPDVLQCVRDWEVRVFASELMVCIDRWSAALD